VTGQRVRAVVITWSGSQVIIAEHHKGEPRSKETLRGSFMQELADRYLCFVGLRFARFKCHEDGRPLSLVDLYEFLHEDVPLSSKTPRQ